ncbi:MAG: hypothetical protein AAB373_04875 [Patescibacteria group bacterium]
MIFNKVFATAFAGLILFSISSTQVFAEDVVNCPGRITGSTPVFNTNAGKATFDAHTGSEFNYDADLTIVGLGTGKAPSTQSDAACTAKKVNVGDQYLGRDYDYLVKGWAWNENGGFISFHCGADGLNNGLTCGNQPYGVYAYKVGATKKLFGYAWSSTYGYIQFEGTGQGGGFTYGVDIDANGLTSGSAWTEAGIYMDFSNLTFTFPDEILDVTPTENWCEGKPWLCIQVDPDPVGLKNEVDSPDVKLDLPLEKQPKVADGKDGYYIHLYLRESDGVTALDSAKYKTQEFLNSIDFIWDDKVKLDQTAPTNKVDVSLARISQPSVQLFAKGAIQFKPISFKDFTYVGPGHYVSKYKITSLAPTAESNVSSTTSTDPVYTVTNEDFFFDVGLDQNESNKLLLTNIKYGDLKKVDDTIVMASGSVLANGKPALAFKFRPALEVSKLYANNYEDVILAYRSIPVNFKVKVEEAEGSQLESGVLRSLDAKVSLNLIYSEDETELEPACYGETVNKNFNFRFSRDQNGNEVTDADKPSLLDSVVKFLDKELDILAVAELPSDAQGLLCSIAKGANLYSTIEYKVGQNTVKYYSNKLPRLPGDAVLNPVIVVHGNVYAQAATNLRADAKTQSAGNVNMNIIRDTINENLEKYLGEVNLREDGNGKCTITSLGAAAEVSGCESGYYKAFDVGTEKVIYFLGSDVTMNLTTTKWIKDWVVISDRGNIFVDGNLYNGADAADRLSLITFRDPGDDYLTTGNIYFAPCANDLTNVQATLIADGSIFSYDGNHTTGLDVTTGEPVWDSPLQMTEALSCQLLFEGTIYSDNTIGGADLDKGDKPKTYLLSGGGKVINLPADSQTRMKAQYYDLNYLRMFKLGLEINEEGLPVDQKCEKGWTADDQKLWTKIANGEISNQSICGAKAGCRADKGILSKDSKGAWNNRENSCNGVDPLSKYNPDDNEGDLMVPLSDEGLADGLNNSITDGDQFDPVYVYYKAPEKGSFVFSKAGAVRR